MPTTERLQDRITESKTYHLFLRMLMVCRSKNSSGNLIWLNKALDNMREMDETELDSETLDQFSKIAISKLDHTSRELRFVPEYTSETTLIAFLSNIFHISKESRNQLLLMLSLSLLTTYASYLKRYSMNHEDLEDVFNEEYPKYFSDQLLPQRKKPVNKAFNFTPVRKKTVTKKNDDPTSKHRLEIQETKHGATEYRLGNLLLSSHGQLSYMEAQVTLSIPETEIIILLMSNADVLITKERFFEKICQRDLEKSEKQLSLKLNAIIHAIRQKIGRLGLVPKIIKSKRGIGYSFQTWHIR